MQKAAFALMLLFATTVWSGDFEDGVAATAKGDFIAGTNFYRKAAARGMPEAQVKLGFNYAFGLGVSKNYVLSYMWLSLAAASGDSLNQQTRDAVAKQMTPQEIIKAQAMALSCLASKYKSC